MPHPPRLRPPALMEELIEQILLRFPPDESAPVFRAALVCKPWRRLITSPGFRRRFCEHHHSTFPMLGFFCTAGKFPFGSGETRFIPTNNKSCPTNILPHAIIPSWRAVDTLGRRVLFHDNDDTAVQTGLIVWNPIDGEVRRLPNMPLYMYRWTAALICAAPGCDHRLTDDCSYGPFRVVVVATGRFDGVTYACVYSSEQDAWSEPIYVPHQFHHDNDYVINSPSVHVNNSVCFTRELHVSNFERSMVILEINLEKREASSLVSLPSACQGLRSALMTTQDRTLGLATVLDTRLCMWSTNDAAAGGWSQTRVIELDKLLPGHYSYASSPHFRLPQVLAVLNHVGIIFVDAIGGPFCIDLKSSRRVTKISDTREKGCSSVDIRGIVPYVTFCTPGQALN